ncbi:PA2779 family protein [Guyparkeria hydrothermalis]|uniref:PA2779 family protein n=1 Tax=Guyparkeria hydrothermalis TaxID=923 RepID=UPI0020200306|nr:PA2779 family protein [Guyparkeria hydrothermalis]MCL7743603.1 PA2779 family protein [Guyparkeria hydrothermalis]
MKRVARIVSPFVIASFTMGSMPAMATPSAVVDGMVTTQEAMSADRTSADRERIAELLNRDDVRNQLVAQGVAPAEVEQRVAALSDEEVRQMNERLDQMPAGANAVVGALFVAFLILLMTDLAGLTHVFPFTR